MSENICLSNSGEHLPKIPGNANFTSKKNSSKILIRRVSHAGGEKLAELSQDSVIRGLLCMWVIAVVVPIFPIHSLHYGNDSCPLVHWVC